MRRRLRYVVLALCVYGAVLLVTFPAWLARPYLERNLPHSVRIDDLHGSVWSGHLLLLFKTANHREVFSRVYFGFRIRPPWPGRWGYALRFTGPLRGHVQVAFGPRSVHLSDLDVRAQATLVAWVPAVRGLGPRGALRLTADRLILGAGLQGQGQVTWRQAALVSAPVSPLGSYVVRFGLERGAIRYEIHTLSGRLQVAGHGRYAVATRVLSFTGDVFGHDLRLNRLVQNVGVADGHGGRIVSFKAPI
ncbi:MAG TPA: type II secretion system protein N [Acidiferrobacter sp.]|nr:type II secretion system protein N [Acidiferrobacter sp.]